MFRQRRLFGLWLLILGLAVTGLTMVDVFRQSLRQTLIHDGREILSADVAVSAHRRFSAQDLRKIHEAAGPGARFSEMVEMFAMVSSGRSSRLAQLRFVDGAYPLLGSLKIETATGLTSRSGRELSGPPVAWGAADWQALLNLNLGDRVRVGQLNLEFAGWIRADSSQTYRLGGMAPRLYLPVAQLENSGLLGFGSTLSHTVFIAGGGDPEILKRRLEKEFPDPAVHVMTPADLEQGSLRVLARMLDYLGLIGLVALALGWVGVYYLGQRWLLLESANVGLLKTLGFSNRELRRHLWSKLISILVGGTLIGGLIAWLSVLALQPSLQNVLPTGFQVSWTWKNSLLLFLIGPLGGAVLLYSALRAVSESTPQTLLAGGRRPASWVAVAASGGVGGALFFALTFLQAHSWRITFVFLTALVGSVFACALAASLALRLLSRFSGANSGWSWHLATSQWLRRPRLSVLLVTVIALSGVLAMFLPHLERTLVEPLREPPRGDRPALFLIDIQDEQIKPLENFLREKGVAISEAAPLIRARVLEVNGRPFEREGTGEWSTRESENEAQFRNRGVNLSYRSALSASEHIQSGLPWARMSAGPGVVDVSIEEGYADRVKYKLGDRIRFDIQGVTIEARVANLRAIDWDSFEPNFFIEFPDGVLNDAPKTWVMTLKKDPRLSPAEIQALVTANFPNVTSINVDEALTAAVKLLGQLSVALRLASACGLTLGFMVLSMILLFQLASSRRDEWQLKMLGVRQGEVLRLQLLTFGSLCLFGLGLGAGLSLAVAGVLARFGFHTPLKPDWVGLLRVFLVATLVSFFALIAMAGISRGTRKLGRAKSLH